MLLLSHVVYHAVHHAVHVVYHAVHVVYHAVHVVYHAVNHEHDDLLFYWYRMGYPRGRLRWLIITY